MISRRNEIVTCTFWRRAGEDRGRDLQKSVLHHTAAQLSDYVAAKYDFLLDSRIAQVKVTVLQTCIFIRFLGTVDFKRKLVVNAFSENLDFLRNDLDFTGRKIRVLTGTLPDNTGNGECGLCIYTGNLIHHFLGLDHDLRRAIKVTQNQEAEIFTYSS